MSDGHLTLSERFDRMEQSLRVLADSSAQLANHDARDQVRIDDHDRRITAVEGWQTWALRIVLGVVLTGVIAAGYFA